MWPTMVGMPGSILGRRLKGKGRQYLYGVSALQRNGFRWKKFGVILSWSNENQYFARYTKICENEQRDLISSELNLCNQHRTLIL